MFFLAILIFVVSPLLISCPQAAQAEEPEVNESEVEYWAVIAGVSDYRVVSFHIDYTDSGAIDLAEQLSSIWGESHVQSFINTEASKDNINDAICQWLDSNEDENDVVLFYFAGHGFFENLVPYDGTSHDVSTMISCWELNKWLDNLESNNVAVILEACESGSFISDLSKSGRVILTSSTQSQSSWVVDFIDHCVFTHFILEALDEYEEADSNGDHEISVEEMFTYTNPKTTDYMEDLEETQTPVMDDQHEGDLGLFYVGVYDMSQHLASIVIDGIEYTKDEMPVTLKYTPWSVHSCEVPLEVNVSSGTRYQFTYWSDGNTSPARYINCGGEYTANYMKMYYLGIESEYGSPNGDGWYYVGTNASISVPASDGVIVRKVFTGWSGDINSSSPEISVYMDGPITAIAGWRNDYSQLYMLVAGIAAIIALGVSFFVRRKRKIEPMITPTDVALPSVQQDDSITPQ